MSDSTQRSKLTQDILRLLVNPMTINDLADQLGDRPRVKATVKNCCTRGEVVNLRKGSREAGLFVRTSEATGTAPRPIDTLDWKTGAELQSAWMRAMCKPGITQAR